MSKIFNDVISIKETVVKELTAILSIEQFDDDFEQKDSRLFSLTHEFADKQMRVEISVYAGQNNAWVDAFWFSAKTEMFYDSEPSFDLLGEYTFELDDSRYSLILE